MSDNGMMGQLASMSDYDPNADFPPVVPPPNTFGQRWNALRDQTPPADAFEAAAQRTRAPFRGAIEREGTSNLPAVAEELWPKEPWQYGAMFAAPGASLVGRGIAALPTAARVGAAATGMVLSGVPFYDTNQAQGGPLDKIAKAAGGIGKSYLSPADQALFAQRYPEAGASVLKPKDSGQGTYPSKIFTDEEARLASARDKVTADMKAQGYAPYFDPSQRYDVDYQKYLQLFGQPQDTATLRTKTKYVLPQSGLDNLDEAYKTGAGLGAGPEGFYKTGQLEREFIDRYGEDEGRRQFVNRFSTPMAATTAGAPPSANLLLSQYGNFMREAGKPLPTDAAYNVPYPVGGGKYGPTGNLQQYEKMLYPGGTGVDYATNPKRYDFDWSFRGRRDAPVIDEQMMKGLTGKVQGANSAPGGYGLYSGATSDRARAFGVDPIQYQEVGWAGLKNQTEAAAAMKRGATAEQAKAQAFQGRPMIADVNDAVERTSRLLQIPPAEVVRRGLVESKLPIYALPAGLGLGAGMMGATAAQDQYR
jgi:hypothetical protein